MGRPTVARGVRGAAALLLEASWVQRSQFTYRVRNDFYLPATLNISLVKSQRRSHCTKTPSSRLRGHDCT